MQELARRRPLHDRFPTPSTKYWSFDWNLSCEPRMTKLHDNNPLTRPVRRLVGLMHRLDRRIGIARSPLPSANVTIQCYYHRSRRCARRSVAYVRLDGILPQLVDEMLARWWR